MKKLARETAQTDYLLLAAPEPGDAGLAPSSRVKALPHQIYKTWGLHDVIRDIRPNGEATWGIGSRGLPDKQAPYRLR